MSNEKLIITVSREYGSGGRKIAKMLAESLGIGFYDGELLSLVAKESGYTEEFVRKNEQKKTRSLLYSLYLSSQILPAGDVIFIAQTKVIQDLAEKESCVIVGRCADYVLRNRENVVNIFIHAPFEKRVERVRDEYKEDAPDNNHKAYVQKKDKERVAYYNYFADENWGKAKSYHLSIDSSIGDESCVRIITDYINEIRSK